MSKKTLNKANLAALGAEQLADLLMEVSTGSADIKRRLRLELSHHLGASELARDVRKRLASLRKSTSFIGWRKRKALVKDLTTQANMITDKIAPEDPTIAFDLLWDFIEIAPFIYGRVDDSRGDVGDVFRAALLHFADIAPRALIDPETLADKVWTAIQDNGFGEWDGISALLAPTLGATGLAHLKANVQAYADAPQKPDPDDHAAIQFLRQLRGDTDYTASRKARFVKSCMQEIAAAAGDTQAYIAQYSDADLKRKDIAAEVAQLLLDDDDPTAALDLLLDAHQDGRDFGRAAWDTAYIAALIALDRLADAQDHRWACFESSLDAQHLRDYLKVLPDFEDVDAETEALAFAADYPDFSTALAFFINWPNLRAAADLVLARADEINGDHYALLTPAADVLREKHPLSAVLLWRRMIDYALGQGRSTRYAHAADNLSDCGLCDAEITDYHGFPDHAHYLQALRNRHDRKTSFWAKTAG
ncbi:hypothetical protein FHS72_000394 [Loktanella ponticola]|uniref:Uncharacterized protein n=1 Tax=Yoonia ponticola TaxID=1524255 RepID=A0A7W9EY63_9RHOB|nr:DUF6880 family protein [Yoonia ponticola]MBB5720790.1 hypothetical protein [Yoonia ponticola]